MHARQKHSAPSPTQNTHQRERMRAAPTAQDIWAAAKPATHKATPSAPWSPTQPATRPPTESMALAAPPGALLWPPAAAAEPMANPPPLSTE
mmetsp:Transcript_19080/g.53872  ORF Transcript_19080/g.53872 Transcript_19080/m.53872 type:complete len:92 (+) Transcript_19080:172-447(+)